MISKRPHLYKRAVLSSEPKTNRKTKKRAPSGFILYKNQNKLNPSNAKVAYENETEDVRIAFERQAEMLRFGADSNFINLDKRSFINSDTSEQVDDTNATVSTVNDSETKLFLHFNNVTNNSSPFEQPIFQTSYEDLLIRNNETSFI
ncbi:15710_t:CDS:1 [Dentiscutata erythropus]|uniref:15710_t:CDS:1 n=1 Tax=Dentiscutata erythropus TaxID=1348616 RepID=A0A9N9IEV7_9GLOM|nr:15710_t:CDS:1 [Dentiscutata erythropus]